MKLLKLTTSKTQTIFQVKVKENDVRMFFTNTEQSDKFEPAESYLQQTWTPTKYNKNSLYTMSDNGTCKVYYNMYDSSTPFYKSAIYKKGKSLRNGTTYDFQDITNHQMSADLINAVQVDNITYAIEPKTPYGRYDLSCDIWSWISVDHTYALPPLKNIETIVYNGQYIKQQLSNDLSIDSDKAVKDKYKQIQYNMIYEINGNIYNDYESGNIATNTFKGKNQFDSLYNMNHDNNNILSNARDYIGIDKCCNQVYLKYYDNVYYDNSQIIHESDNGNRFGFKYQNIEIIKSINRFESFNGHKANLYSIAINTDIIEEIRHKNYGNKDLECLVKNITSEIKNCVRAIAETIQPAHTQLYKVYVNGD